jgi:hypothetical protein
MTAPAIEKSSNRVAPSSENDSEVGVRWKLRAQHPEFSAHALIFCGWVHHLSSKSAFSV